MSFNEGNDFIVDDDKDVTSSIPSSSVSFHEGGEEEEVEEEEEEEEEEEDTGKDEFISDLGTGDEAKQRDSSKDASSAVHTSRQSPQVIPAACTASASAFGGVHIAGDAQGRDSTVAAAAAGGHSRPDLAPPGFIQAELRQRLHRFLDFPAKSVVGREKHRGCLSESEEALAAKAVLAKFELSLPTTRFDDELENILSAFC